MRQPQRVWKTFYRLKLRANFFIGKALFEKTSFCTGRSLGYGPSSGPTIQFVAPWTVVRSDEFVNKRITPAQLALLNAAAVHRNEKNKKILERYVEGRVPYTKDELEGTPYTGGRTHYVGDDCPGGHTDCDPHVAVGYQAKLSDISGTQNTLIGQKEVADANWETAGGTTPEQNEARFPKQPSSDNNVTGPTS